ncbi:HEAT repeat domain-containing protein [Bryobacter aggregatus]|uniref:HEAT repeat domain-containing protein n=1 Tax=Bryobacter aggregatus TaxID=360054 RepID=UPI0012BA5E3B|nr:HEAT repeat domain-containing protein [Bryobacter aggregatus]
MSLPTFDIEQLKRNLQSPDSDVRGLAMQSLSIRVKHDPLIHAEALQIFRSSLRTETQAWPIIRAAHGIETILGAHEARPVWLSLLRHEDPKIVGQAAMALRDPAYVPAMIAALDRLPGREVRENLIRALGRTKDPSVAPKLVEQLADPQLRAHTVEALGDLGDPRVIPALEALLGDASEAWPVDNHGPMLYIRDLAKQSIERLQKGQGPITPFLAVPAVAVASTLSWGPRALVPYVPLLAAIAQIIWAFFVLAWSYHPQGGRGRTPAQTHLLDFVAIIPAGLGLLYAGLAVFPIYGQLSGFEKLCLIAGCIGCALIALPFAMEFFN